MESEPDRLGGFGSQTDIWSMEFDPRARKADKWGKLAFDKGEQGGSSPVTARQESVRHREPLKAAHKSILEFFGVFTMAQRLSCKCLYDAQQIFGSMREFLQKEALMLFCRPALCDVRDNVDQPARLAARIAVEDPPVA